MTASERRRIAAILGMLGSNAAGERDTAARMAEEFRRKHRLTWDEMLGLPAAEPELVGEPATPPPPPPRPKAPPPAAAPSPSRPNPEPKKPTPTVSPSRRVTPPTNWFERYLIAADANPVGAFFGAIWVIGAVVALSCAAIFGR